MTCYYQAPVFGIETQGSLGSNEPSFCNNSIEIPSGDRTINKELVYSGSKGWWNSENEGAGLFFEANAITDRVVSGDFDNDGFHDDIATVYALETGGTAIRVFAADGTSFNYQGDWVNFSNYTASKVTGRVVSGDFDQDGFEDDIVAFYDYGSRQTRAHVFLGKKTSLSYQYSRGWWSSTAFEAASLTNKLVVGDFYNTGYNTDIAAAVAGNLTLFKSSGTALEKRTVSVIDYSGNDSDRVVVGDFSCTEKTQSNCSNRANDIAILKNALGVEGNNTGMEFKVIENIYRAKTYHSLFIR